MNTAPNSLKDNYTTFYLIMLLLSTVGTLAGLYGLLSVSDYLARANGEPVFAITNLFLAVIVAPAALVALILLWKKHSLGIWLKLNTYGASIVSYIILILFTEKSVLTTLVEDTSKSLTSTPEISDEFIQQTVHATYYSAIAIAIVGSVLFAILW